MVGLGGRLRLGAAVPHPVEHLRGLQTLLGWGSWGAGFRDPWGAGLRVDKCMLVNHAGEAHDRYWLVS